MTENMNPLRGTLFIRVVGIAGASVGLAVLVAYLLARITGEVVAQEEWALLKSNHGPWHYDWGWVFLPALLMSFFAGVTVTIGSFLLAISNRSFLPLRSGAIFAILNVAVFLVVSRVVYWAFD